MSGFKLYSVKQVETLKWYSTVVKLHKDKCLKRKERERWDGWLVGWCMACQHLGYLTIKSFFFQVTVCFQITNNPL